MVQNKVKSYSAKLFLNEIIKYVTVSSPQVIIEYNAGYGYITREILAKMHQGSILYALEMNIEKCKTLCEINDKRLRVRILSAEEVNKIIYYEKTVDCIISSVPFKDYSKEAISKIIIDSCKLLKNDGSLIQVFDTKVYISLYQKYFKYCTFKVFLNNPILWVYECQKKIKVDIL
ncbi:MAG TPA: methyltransferase [Candidatus Paceibacterota bacterium]|nr:methyltransferase [Candidatus Paceibacterota bacterium]HPS18424.1 methyltransferase [Bacteroidales bacterium]